jgi:hypothetical protein
MRIMWAVHARAVPHAELCYADADPIFTDFSGHTFEFFGEVRLHASPAPLQGCASANHCNAADCIGTVPLMMLWATLTASRAGDWP